MSVVLINHWKCCGGTSNKDRREEQAIQMNSFAVETPGIPIISGGDFNIPINTGGQSGDAFITLSQRWEYRDPGQDVGTFRSGTILDAVFVTNRVQGWESATTILKRVGHGPATTENFTDDSDTTDHRPLLLVVESNATDRLEELREVIAELEAALARLKAEVERLEGR